MSKPRKFTSTIYCANCCNVGEYEFPYMTVLVPVLNPWYGGGKSFIRLMAETGPDVECQFCGITRALHLRERNGASPAESISRSGEVEG